MEMTSLSNFITLGQMSGWRGLEMEYREKASFSSSMCLCCPLYTAPDTRPFSHFTSSTLVASFMSLRMASFLSPFLGKVLLGLPKARLFTFKSLSKSSSSFSCSFARVDFTKDNPRTWLKPHVKRSFFAKVKSRASNLARADTTLQIITIPMKSNTAWRTSGEFTGSIKLTSTSQTVGNTGLIARTAINVNTSGNPKTFKYLKMWALQRRTPAITL